LAKEIENKYIDFSSDNLKKAVKAKKRPKFKDIHHSNLKIDAHLKDKDDL